MEFPSEKAMEYINNNNAGIETGEVRVVVANAAPDPKKEAHDTGRRGRKIWIGLIVLLIVAVTTVVAAVVASGTQEEKSSERSPSTSPDCRRLVEVFDESSIRRLQEDARFQGIGCFRIQDSTDHHTVEGFTEKEKAEACSDLCLTRHFGIAGTTCYCYVDAPQERLTIGSCSVSPSCVERSQEMEVYFKTSFTGECNQATTSSVRNFLVEENDAPFGYDIVRNIFRQSPFELYKEDCGTNIYEVQTEISEGSQEMATEVKEVKEFALERRSSSSQSISASAEGGRKGLLFQASAKVSASYDSDQNNMFKSSGADEAGSKVFTSVGVKRVAEVRLADFDNKRYFVTFSPQFGRLLRTYKESGFSNETAYEIFNKYGMFVMTRGIFGGYIQYRTTATRTAMERLFETDEDSRRCFEASVSGKASGFGFSGSFEVGAGQCTEAAAAEMEALQQSYASESSEQVVVGGTKAGGEFVVPPELSTLLTSKDKYPPGDPGIQLRVLSDFLSPQVVSPLEVKRYLLTETDFSEIQRNLQNHILEELQRIKGIITDGCGECPVPYLEQTDDGFACVCYDPQNPSPPPIAAFAGTYDFQTMFGGNSGTWGNDSSGTMVISPDGTIIRSGKQVTVYEFDETERRLTWSTPEKVNIRFHDSLTSNYYFKDQPGNTATECFVGSLQRPGAGGVDFRGILMSS